MSRHKPQRVQISSKPISNSTAPRNELSVGIKKTLGNRELLL